MKMDEIIKIIEYQLETSIGKRDALQIGDIDRFYFVGKFHAYKLVLDLLRQYCADQAPCLDCGTITADGEVLPAVTE